MEFFVDTSDIDTIKRINGVYPIDGFTTNPSILAAARTQPEILFRNYKEYTQMTKQKVFVQVTGKSAVGMTREACALSDYFGDSLVVKLPAVEEGYRAIRLCKDAGIAVCVTVVHSAMQGILAAKAGADYVAPYISHIDNIGADGVGCAEEMVKVFGLSGYATKVLGASFRTADQVLRLAIAGCHAVTLAPALFDMLIAHPSTDASMAKFERVWREAFGDAEVSDYLPDC